MSALNSFFLTLWLFSQLDFMLLSFWAAFLLLGIRWETRHSKWILVGIFSVVWLLIPIANAWTSLLITAVVWTIQVSYDVYIKKVDPDVPKTLWNVARWSRKIKIL